MEETQKERYSSRKFRLAATCLLLGFISLWVNKITGSEGIYFIMGILALYFGGNVSSEYIKKSRDKNTEE